MPWSTGVLMNARGAAPHHCPQDGTRIADTEQVGRTSGPVVPDELEEVLGAALVGLVEVVGAAVDGRRGSTRWSARSTRWSVPTRWTRVGAGEVVVGVGAGEVDGVVTGTSRVRISTGAPTSASRERNRTVLLRHDDVTPNETVDESRTSSTTLNATDDIDRSVRTASSEVPRIGWSLAVIREACHPA